MNACKFLRSLFIAASLTLLGAGHAEVHSIRSAAELRPLAALLKPGDTVILASGTYLDQHFVFTGTGTADQPITLRAQIPGKALLGGGSRLSIGGRHLVVEGLRFQGGALKSGSVIEFRDSEGLPSHSCVLRNTAILDYNPEDVETKYFWVSLYGSGHVVEDCTFSGQRHTGVTLVVRLEQGKEAGHLIRRNHFANRPEGTGNGFESIRIGTGKNRMVNAKCLVIRNLFEACNGEIEIVSNKSCGNRYEQNTFLECSGTLTLRQGNHCRVVGNLFLAGDAERSGGVRVTGEGHHISGNFFSGTKGRAGGAISLRSGTNAEVRGAYPQVKNCVIDGNTFVENQGTLFALDAGYNPETATRLPEAVTISDQLLVMSPGADPAISARYPSPGIRWRNTVLVSRDPQEDLPEGIRVVSEVPENLKERLTPNHLRPTDVGAVWLREERAGNAP